MRRLVLMAVMALFPVILSAQVKHGSEFEVGAGFSIYGITGYVGGLSRNAGPTAYLGYGYRFHDNFDALFRASYKNGNVKGWTHHSENPTYVNIKCNQVEGMLGVDYVILPSKRFVRLSVQESVAEYCSRKWKTRATAMLTA